MGKISTNRNTAIQYLFNEISVPADVFDLFQIEQSIAHLLNPWGEQGQLFLDRQDQLYHLFWQKAETVLTDKQRTIISLIRQGFNQAEIAKISHNNQSTIQKAIYGTPLRGKMYGGIIRKLQSLIENDLEIRLALCQLHELDPAAHDTAPDMTDLIYEMTYRVCSGCNLEKELSHFEKEPVCQDCLLLTSTFGRARNKSIISDGRTNQEVAAEYHITPFHGRAAKTSK